MYVTMYSAPTKVTNVRVTVWFQGILLFKDNDKGVIFISIYFLSEADNFTVSQESAILDSACTG